MGWGPNSILILDAGSLFDFIALFSSFCAYHTHSTDDINTKFEIMVELFLYAIKVTGSTKQTKIN